jgi:hypothetical protein
MAFETPILFLIFNRPDLTGQVFGTIRDQKPARLYVAADGPRPHKSGELQLCTETREIIEQVDWDCAVRKLYRDENLGCGRAVSEAISWFFEQESEGIILEDDCLPDASFYSFCCQMLERYRDNEKVGSVSGNNFLPPGMRAAAPYGFSKYAQIWGWATWARFWKNYDFELSGEEEEWEEIIRRVNPIEYHARYWIEVFRAMKSGLLDTWDYQVIFSAWKNDFVHIYPSRNLISNLGYGETATHTNFESPLAGLKAERLENFEVTLPVNVDPQFDGVIFYFRFLESLTNVWWLAQAMDLTGIVGWCRWQLVQTHRELRMFKQADESRDQQVQTILRQRSRFLYRARFTLLIGHFVFTMRQILSLGRAKLNEVFGKIASGRQKRVSGPRLPGSRGDVSEERQFIDESETLQRRPPV